MKPTTALTILACTFLGSFAYSQYHLSDRIEVNRLKVEKETAAGRAWMKTTTAQLDRIHSGVEQLTGETLELVQRIDNLESRITHLETAQ